MVDNVNEQMNRESNPHLRQPLHVYTVQLSFLRNREVWSVDSESALSTLLLSFSAHAIRLRSVTAMRVPLWLRIAQPVHCVQRPPVHSDQFLQSLQWSLYPGWCILNVAQEPLLEYSDITAKSFAISSLAPFAFAYAYLFICHLQGSTFVSWLYLNICNRVR